jgi:signal transduction histidine kinase
MPAKRPQEEETDIIALKQALAERTKELNEAREALARQERVAMLGSLVSTVAHELRSPLGAILTSLHLVENRMGDADEGAKKGLDRIRRSVRRSDEIITNLLDYSRYEPLALEETRIDQWLRALFHAQTLPEGISLRFEPGFGDNVLSIDREKLHRAIGHLIQNAAQALREAGAGGQIAVTTRKTLDSLQIEVSDPGPGIPAEYRDAIFEPFFSGRKAGIGLGLPLAKRIVDQHGGTIGFESRPGEKTTFTITLPLHR